MKKQVAVIGGGMSGLSCAFHLAKNGCAVSLFEAAPVLGGRARVVLRHPIHTPNAEIFPHSTQYLDNGPHLMLGAYREFFQTIYQAHKIANSKTPAHIEDFLSQYFYRAPFAMQSNSINICMGAGNRLQSLWQTWQQTSGWQWREIPQLIGFTVALITHRSTDETVLQWLLRNHVPKRWINEILSPLCLSALNTEAEAASANVFIAVLRRVFFGPTDGFEMRWSKVDLATLIANPLQQAINHLGGYVYTHQLIRAIKQNHDGSGYRLIPWHLTGVKSAMFDKVYSHVVLALPARQSAKLLTNSNIKVNITFKNEKGVSVAAELKQVVAWLNSFQHRAIANVSVFMGKDSKAKLKRWLKSAPVLVCQNFQGNTIIWLNHHAVTPNRVNNDGAMAGSYVIQPPMLTAIYSCLVPKNLKDITSQALLTRWQQHDNHTLMPEDLLSGIEQMVIQERFATHAANVVKTLSHRIFVANSTKSPTSLYLTGDYLLPLLPATLESATIAGRLTADIV